MRNVGAASTTADRIKRTAVPPTMPSRSVPPAAMYRRRTRNRSTGVTAAKQAIRSSS
jgi:hypothetical protein